MAIPKCIQQDMQIAVRLRAKGEYKKAAARLRLVHNMLKQHRLALEQELAEGLTGVVEGLEAVDAEIALIKEAAGK